MANLFKGHPSEHLLPRQELIKGTQALLSPTTRPGDEDEEIRHPLTYGSDPGAETVRQLIAEWSLKKHGEGSYGPIDKDAINLTNGASFGAQTALQQATAAQIGYTRQAFIISPTYFLINGIIADAGFNGKMTAVPESADGVDLGFLQKELEHHDALHAKDDPQKDQKEVDAMLGEDPDRHVYRYVLYCVPTFSNPRGSTMSLDTRKRLVDLARKHDVLIICDDVYDLLDYSSPKGGLAKLPRLVTVDRSTLQDETSHGNTISNCTFSKLLAPGFRVGWQETASKHLAQQMSRGGAIRSGGTPAHMNTMIVGELLKDGTVDTVIARLCETYSERATAIKQALDKYLPKGTLVQGGDGGYFFWVTMPEGYSAAKITRECAKRGVVLAPESSFQVQGDERDSDRCFRVSLSYESSENAVEGIKIWGQVCVQLS